MNAVEFYLSRPRPLSRGDIVEIARMTTGQRNNPEWLSLRQHCLTASLFKKALGASVRQELMNQFMRTYLHPCHPTPAMTYGCEMEAEARKAYCKKTGFHVRETGLWLFPSGNLGASPDGLVYEEEDDREALGLVEIKCPYSMRDGTAQELEAFAVKHNKEHYVQVQGQLAATRIPWCDLVYWSPKGLWRMRIKKELCWARLHVQTLEEFYRDYVQPAKMCMHVTIVYF